MRHHNDPTKCPKPGRQLKPRRPPQPRQPPQAQGRCTRYVAVHPLRGGAPEQKRCIAYGSGAVPQQTRTNAELAHRTTHRRTPPCAAGPYWRQDGHAAHAATCTPAHSDTSYTLTCEEPNGLFACERVGGTQDRIRDRAIVVGQARGDVDRDDGPRLDGGEPVEELHGFRECARERALAPVPTMLSIRACARNTSDHAGVFSMERSDCPPRSMMRTTAAATSPATSSM